VVDVHPDKIKGYCLSKGRKKRAVPIGALPSPGRLLSDLGDDVVRPIGKKRGGDHSWEKGEHNSQSKKREAANKQGFFCFKPIGKKKIFSLKRADMEGS